MSNGPETTTTVETPTEILTRELGRYGDALLPGTAAIIAQRNPTVASLPPDKRAEKVAEMIEGPIWAKFRNNEYAPAKLENGQEVSPLRAALTRHSGELLTGAVDELMTKLAPMTINKTPAQIAGMVVRFLASRDAEPFAAFSRPKPRNEQRIIDVAAAHFGDVLDHDARNKFARERARDAANRDERGIFRMIADSLKGPGSAARYGAGTIANGDPRLVPGREPVGPKAKAAAVAAKVEPVRQADGPFVAPPVAKPERERPSF
jgi:hypothetical protein